MSSLPRATITLEVPFHDVDSLDIVWHGHYAKYFELARCQLLKEIGYTYQDMRDSGYSWPVVELYAKYVQPLVFGQQVQVMAQLVEWENRLKISYVVSDVANGHRLTKGYTVQVAVDIAKAELQFESPAILGQKLGFGARP